MRLINVPNDAVQTILCRSSRREGSMRNRAKCALVETPVENEYGSQLRLIPGATEQGLDGHAQGDSRSKQPKSTFPIFLRHGKMVLLTVASTIDRRF